MASASVAVTVDGTLKECTGIIAALEKAMQRLEEGAAVRAIVADVPSRIDVHAWAERKGHAIPRDVHHVRGFILTVVKGGLHAGDVPAAR